MLGKDVDAEQDGTFSRLTSEGRADALRPDSQMKRVFLLVGVWLVGVKFGGCGWTCHMWVCYLFCLCEMETKEGGVEKKSVIFISEVQKMFRGGSAIKIRAAEEQK